MKATIHLLVRLSGVLLFSSTLLFAQMQPEFTPRNGTSYDYRTYGIGAMPELVEASNAHRSGSWEQAILIYDNLIAQWPNSAPLYVKRAMTLARMGRSTEAENDLEQARRLSLNAVLLFTENQPAGRLNLLTSYPFAAASPETDKLLDEINAFVRSGQFVKVTTRLEDLRDHNHISPVHYDLLRGNLELLLNDYPDAIAYYDRALQLHTDPHILHNRGLARILNHNYIDGCADLLQAEVEGYATARDHWIAFCNW